MFCTILYSYSAVIQTNVLCLYFDTISVLIKFNVFLMEFGYIIRESWRGKTEVNNEFIDYLCLGALLLIICGRVQHLKYWL